MSYKIVKNAIGDVIAFGPNDENYVPTIKDGEILIIESGKTAEESIKNFQNKQRLDDADLITKKAAAEAKLSALGLTDDDLKALGI
jgi:hypothetical protein